jgi:hypothetical protein
LAGLSEIAARRRAALEHTLELLGLEITIPSTKASPVEQLAFQAQIMEAIAERVIINGKGQKDG